MQEKLHLSQHPGLNPPSFSTTIKEISDEGLFFDKTYCYPRGGGQPGDRGAITSKLGVSKMNEVTSGEHILHPVDDIDLFNRGDEIMCEIDHIWRNRNSKMHTAQHVFSALANELYHAETVGNQISESYTRIDLWFPDRDKFDAKEIVEEVNQVLRAGSDVLIHEWSREKILSHKNMRHTKFMDRIPQSITNLRVVEIEGIDLCPCGGTHVGNTKEVENISIENVKSKGSGKLRISYS
tara:strand:- start:77 stop:790 length:714 start_codon:yes stop_codon:yes gene_type:complete